MIRIGDNEVLDIRVGDDELMGAYCEDILIYPTSPPPVPCNPLVIVNYKGNTNNQGRTINSDFYLFDSGITAITTCDFDFTGIKSICHRSDSTSFNKQVPVASLGNLYQGNNPMGCLNSIVTFEADCSTVQTINYPFGNDRIADCSQNLTSCTFYNTDNVTYLGNFVYYQPNLKSVRLGNMSSVTGWTAVFNNYNSGITDFQIEAFPDRNIDWGFNYCTGLSVQSLLNILNALPQTSGRTITIGTTNKNKLSAEQISIATNKGWTVN